METWDELYRQFTVDRPSDDEPLPKPTDADFDNFKQQTGYLLPRSYREFGKFFGPGE